MNTQPQPPPRPQIKYKRGYKPPRPGRKNLPGRVKVANAVKKRTERRYGLDPKKVCSAIAKAHGSLTKVCEFFRIPRSTMIRYLERNEICREALDHAREDMGDIAESKLFEHIESGDIRCLLFYLSTVHRQRGYGLGNSNAVGGASTGGPVFVDTVNIIGVPSGTFLPPEIANRDNMVIEGEIAE
jgi:hypothetical protein